MAHYTISVVAREQQAAAAPELTELGRLRWTSLSCLEEVDGPGRLTVRCEVDQLTDTVKERIRNPLATPSELWAFRDGMWCHAGPLLAYTLADRVLELTAPGLGGYVAGMHANPLTGDLYQWTSTDLASIVSSLVGLAQAESYGHMGLSTAALTALGVTGDLTVSNFEPRTLDRVFEELGHREAGYEWWVDPESRQVRLASPRRGTDRTEAVFIDRRAVASSRVGVSIAAGQAATVVRGSTNGTGGAMFTTATDSETLAQFGRWTVARQYADISNASTLADNVARDVAELAAPRREHAPRLQQVTGASVEDFEVGDLVTYSYDGGLGLETLAVRVLEKEVSVDTSGNETLAVALQ